MGNFNKGGNFRGNGSGGHGGGHGFSGHREDKPMYPATCSECGNRCEVPFKPFAGKPVFCKDCFRKDGDSGPARRDDRRDSGPSQRFDSRDSGRNHFDDRKMFVATCSECGRSCELPFKPTGEKPVFCKDCFGMSRSDNFAPRKSEPSKDPFESLNAKLDKVIKLLEILAPKKQFVVTAQEATEAKTMPEEKAVLPKLGKAKRAEKPVKPAKPVKAAKPAKAKKKK